MSFEPGDIVELIDNGDNLATRSFLGGLRGEIQKAHPRMSHWWWVHFPQRDYTASCSTHDLRKVSAVELLGDIAK